jgi:hypothetical protein
MSQRVFGSISLTAYFSVVLLLGSAVPSSAFFEKLDHLSGPGPFHGFELQFRTLCHMNQPSRTEAANALATALKETEPLASGRVSSEVFDSEFAMRASRLFQTVDTKLAAADFLELAALSRRAASRVAAASDVLIGQRTTAQAAWLRSEEVLRAAAVPSLRHSPGLSLWASCYDRPLRSKNQTFALPARGTDPAITESVRYEDRHPTFSLNLNYRYYTTGGYFGLDRLKGSEQYANGEDIHLHVFEVQPSWPLSGRLDILDGQVGLGMYVFTSEGFETFHGVILEPIRLDFHFPARLLDQTDVTALRILTSLSVRAGYVMFPTGIAAEKFNPTRRVAHDIPRDELTFSWGVVVDVGRLFGK